MKGLGWRERCGVWHFHDRGGENALCYDIGNYQAAESTKATAQLLNKEQVNLHFGMYCGGCRIALRLYVNRHR